MKYIGVAIIPMMVLLITSYGVAKGVKVYECFVDGAKEGIEICIRIFPYLLAMLLVVGVFRASNAMNYFIAFLSPVTNLIGIPGELIPLIFIKPLSGSGAMGVFTDILKTHSADTFIGIAASIIMGTTETIFYTLTVYYGAVKIKKIRHTLWAAILADLVGVIVAVNVARIVIHIGF